MVWYICLLFYVMCDWMKVTSVHQRSLMPGLWMEWLFFPHCSWTDFTCLCRATFLVALYLQFVHRSFWPSCLMNWFYVCLKVSLLSCLYSQCVQSNFWTACWVLFTCADRRSETIFATILYIYLNQRLLSNQTRCGHPCILATRSSDLAEDN